jgi:AhpD family alkylhydroperoxidase
MPPRARVLPPPGAPDDPVAGSALAHQPEALRAFERLYGTLWSRGCVDHALKEMTRLRNARITGCVYCQSVRFSRALEEGLSEEVCELITDDFAASALDARQKAALRLTDALLRRPRAALDPELRAELLRHFSPGQVVELAAGVAIFMGFSKIAVALGGMPEELPRSVVLTPDWPETASSARAVAG